MTEKAGIVGTGVIGREWTILFAHAGYDVHVFDTAPGAAESALQRIQGHGPVRTGGYPIRQFMLGHTTQYVS